jgi:poly-gamma-glutamate synthesis protein (capsule biosynthesis protein)
MSTPVTPRWSGGSWRLRALRLPDRDPAAGIRIGVLGVTDHPADFAAAPDRPGVAFADLRRHVPGWLLQTVADMAERVDIAIVTFHWGRNMTTAPEPHVMTAAQALRGAGADRVSGHSAHVFHGVAGPVLFDLGDFIDGYRPDPDLRNDLGLLFIVTVDKHGPIGLEAVPIGLEFCRTRLARPDEADWIRHRFTTASAQLGTEVTTTGAGRLAIALR